MASSARPGHTGSAASDHPTPPHRPAAPSASPSAVPGPTGHGTTTSPLRSGVPPAGPPAPRVNTSAHGPPPPPRAPFADRPPRAGPPRRTRALYARGVWGAEAGGRPNRPPPPRPFTLNEPSFIPNRIISATRFPQPFRPLVTFSHLSSPFLTFPLALPQRPGDSLSRRRNDHPGLTGVQKGHCHVLLQAQNPPRPLPPRPRPYADGRVPRPL